MSRWERIVGWRSPTDVVIDRSSGRFRSEGKRKGDLCGASRSVNAHKLLEASSPSEAEVAGSSQPFRADTLRPLPGCRAERKKAFIGQWLS